MSKTNFILGIEGGGTKTGWALIDPKNKILAQGEADRGNTLLLSNDQLVALFKSIKTAASNDVDAIGGAFASCYFEEERARVKKCLRQVWPNAKPMMVVGDAESALLSCHGKADGISVIAGTGSNVVAQKSGKLFKAGGWGHLFSDPGSGYALARRGLEAVFRHYDQTEKVPLLGQIFLRDQAQNSLEELVPWILQKHSSKSDVAAMAPCLFEAAEKGDRLAKKVMEEGAFQLAEAVTFLIRRLKLKQPPVGLVGGLFEKSPLYERAFRRSLNRLTKGCHVFRRTSSGAIAAAQLVHHSPEIAEIEKSVSIPTLPAVAKSMTEQRNPRSRGLNRKSTKALVRLFIDEEKWVINAMKNQEQNIARACDLIAQRLQKGGRLFYIGAGTSGRLGVVDASEMPPTFNASPDQIQAIIAGGAQAVFASQEGAEDNRKNGKSVVHQRGIKRGDVLCGIAASGQTPFVLAALEEANRLKIDTILLSCNPNRLPSLFIKIAIDLPTGAEIVTGSTRLKAGTVTKLVLNMMSTIAMIRLGRVHDNLMIDVQATNAKLRQRAQNLVKELIGCNDEKAYNLLIRHQWSVRRVFETLKKK